MAIKQMLASHARPSAFAFTLSALLAMASKSHALALMVANCETGRLKIEIVSEGAPGRVPTLTATIFDTDHPFEKLRVQERRGFRSASFGRKTYEDTETEGQRFLLQGPSTNYRAYSISVTPKIGNSIVLDDINCPQFR